MRITEHYSAGRALLPPAPLFSFQWTAFLPGVSTKWASAHVSIFGSAHALHFKMLNCWLMAESSGQGPWHEPVRGGSNRVSVLKARLGSPREYLATINVVQAQTPTFSPTPARSGLAR